MPRPRNDVRGLYQWGTPPGPAPLCECGCGKPVTVMCCEVRRWLKGHHRTRWKRPGFTAAQAKVFERLFREYGLTPESYAALEKEQCGLCAICQTDNPGKGLTMWCVDHDHESGKVRGLLCQSCNAALGLFRESATVLESAIEYLRRSSCA